jgi:protein-tyrosine phosphatase
LHVSPNSLDAFLNDPTALILDIRPHAAYSSARIPRALSLSVPSTLLKRPLFSLARLCGMLPCQSARTRFSAWPSASRIIVYDADATAIPDSSNIQGLLRKFKKDGFQGDLAWLQGGFQAVWRERRDIIDTNPPTPEAELDDDDDRLTLSTLSSSPTVSILQPRHLPMSAFSLSSTTAYGACASASSTAKSKHRPKSIPLPTSQPPVRNAYNPFFDAVRQNVELSQGITERIPLQLPRRIHRRIADLPFTWLQDIAKKAQCAPRVPHHHHLHNHRPLLSAAPQLPSSSSSSSSDDTSDSDTSPDPADIEEGTEALAMQFYRIEVAEQRRLMSVMERHSRESGLVGGAQPSLTFPYSITAGIEKGTKNRWVHLFPYSVQRNIYCDRYRHIWPFEHARVRLHCRNEGHKRKDAEGRSVKRDADDADNDDYVNASYVQPLGTTRRYIATQGPLETTFNDFWR